MLWLKPFGFSNSQSLAVKKEYAQKHQLVTLSDLAKISSTLNIAAPPEFLMRPDAFPGLSQVYGLRFKKIIQVDPNLMYSAINNQKVELIAAFTNDGRLRGYNLITLKDDKNFYPSYHAAPVVRRAVLEAHPQIYSALACLFGSIDEEIMMKLNYKVDVEGMSPREVARQFLNSLEGNLTNATEPQKDRIGK